MIMRDILVLLLGRTKECGADELKEAEEDIGEARCSG